MNLSDRRNYELHRAVAEKIGQNSNLLNIALRNLDQLQRQRGDQRYYCRWREIIEQGSARVIEALLDTGEEGQVLRSSSPFTGILTNDERISILSKLQSARTSR